MYEIQFWCSTMLKPDFQLQKKGIWRTPRTQLYSRFDSKCGHFKPVMKMSNFARINLIQERWLVGLNRLASRIKQVVPSSIRRCTVFVTRFHQKIRLKNVQFQFFSPHSTAFSRCFTLTSAI